MITLGPETLALLAGAAFVAGFIDSIAGGGGLITLPALLLAGASPIEALATNKIQGLFGAGSAAISYSRAGLVDLRGQLPWAGMAFGASLAGAALISHVPTDALRMVLPVLLVAIALFFALKPGLSDQDRTRKMEPLAFGLGVVPIVAAYDGLVGPGAGAFYMLAFVTLAGQGLLRATAHTKFLNFSSNVGGLLAFTLFASPLWGVGIMMGLAQVAGAQLGSRVAMRIGARLIRPLLVTTSVTLAAKLIYDAMSAS